MLLPAVWFSAQGDGPPTRPPGAHVPVRHTDTEKLKHEPRKCSARWVGGCSGQGVPPGAQPGRAGTGELRAGRPLPGGSQCHRTDRHKDRPGAERGASRQRGLCAKVREVWGHAELGPETELEVREAMRLTLKVRKVTVRPLPAWPPASFLGLQVGDVLCFSFCRRGSPQSGDLLEVTWLERRQRDGSPVLLLQVRLGGRHSSGTGATLAL